MKKGSKRRSYQAISIDEHIGSRIKMRRHEKGVSQMDLAASLGLTFQQVQKYEKGTNRVGGSRMLQVANALGVNVSYFFHGLEGEAKCDLASDGVMDKFIASAEGMSIAMAFDKIGNLKTKRAIVAMVKTLSEEQVAP